MFGYFLGKVETSASGDCERLREEEAALPKKFLNAFYATRFRALNVHIKYDKDSTDLNTGHLNIENI